jgi:hypothetical protein
MSVTVLSVVDAIGIEVETDRVVLALSDHLSWGTRVRLRVVPFWSHRLSLSGCAPIPGELPGSR